MSEYFILPGLKSRSILIVEDNEDDRLLLNRALKMAAVPSPLAFASDVQSAKDYLWEASLQGGATPCLVLLDLSLPMEGGLDFLRAIRADAKTRRIPVIIITGSQEQQDLIDSYQCGANSYIAKVGNLNEFCEKISCLSKYWLNICQLPAT